MGIGERIQALRGNASRAEFAKRVGVNANTLRNYEQELSLPNSDIVAKICSEFGATPAWLLWGEGPMYDSERTQAQRAGDSLSKVVVLAGPGLPLHPDAPGCELIMVPKVTARLSAGGGSFEVETEVKGLYAFQAAWLRAKGKPEDLVLMEVTGDSMEPEIRNGDTVLINQGQREVLAGKVYAVGIEDTVVVKQVERLPGKLVLRSTNPAHPQVEINMSGDLASTVRIIGRVIWWCHEAR